MTTKPTSRAVPLIVAFAILLGSVGIGLVPILLSRAKRAEERFAPVESELTDARSNLKQEQERFASETKLTQQAKTALEEKIAGMQSTFDRELDSHQLKERELADSLVAAEKELQQVRSQPAYGSEHLADIQALVGAATIDKALPAIRSRLAQLDALKRESAEYAAKNKKLQSELLALRQGSEGWRPATSPPVLGSVIAERHAPVEIVTVYCQPLVEYEYVPGPPTACPVMLAP